MTQVLLTAFEPYDRWPDNASWLALTELTHWYDGAAELTTRRYPVDLPKMSERLQQDLRGNYDLAIHCGQAPGASQVRVEAVGLNLRTDGTELVPGGPTAHRCRLPLERIVDQMRSAGIPAKVSAHAGTYLCNAALFLSQHYSYSFGMKTQSVFVHLPLTPAQVAKDTNDAASMSTPMASAALAVIIRELALLCRASATT